VSIAGQSTTSPKLVAQNQTAPSCRAMPMASQRGSIMFSLWPSSEPRQPKITLSAFGKSRARFSPTEADAGYPASVARVPRVLPSDPT